MIGYSEVANTGVLSKEGNDKCSGGLLQQLYNVGTFTQKDANANAIQLNCVVSNINWITSRNYFN